MARPRPPISTPYRLSARPRQRSPAFADERALLLFIMVVGLARLALTLRTQERWDGATTGLVGLALLAARRLFALERGDAPPR